MKGQLALLAVSLILAQGQEQVALPDSNVEPAITGLASTSFFKYASSVAVELIKVRLALQLANWSHSTTCLIQAHWCCRRTGRRCTCQIQACSGACLS